MGVVRWTVPLRDSEITFLTESNRQNGPVEVIDGPIGPMLKLVCSLNMSQEYHNKVFYCGGNGNQWMEEDFFFETYPELDPRPKIVVDMELDEIHHAEEIMEGLCRDDQ